MNVLVFSVRTVDKLLRIFVFLQIQKKRPKQKKKTSEEKILPMV